MNEKNKTNTQNNKKKDNLPILRSTSKETKNRFENLLKNALNQKNETRKTSASPKKLKTNVIEKHVDEKDLLSKIQEIEITATDTSVTAENSKTTENQIDPNRENYILEKFLCDATSIKQEDKALTPDLPIIATNVISYIKPPLPLPRARSIKNKISTDESSTSSNRTYSISSAKITNTELLKDIDRLSFSSVSTYNIIRPSKESLLPDTTNEVETYIRENKHNISTVGEVIVHSADATSAAPVTQKKINIVEQKLFRKISAKIDVSKLQTDEIQEIIDNRYREIAMRNNMDESCTQKDDTLMNIEDNLSTIDSISTSKMISSQVEIKPYTYENLIGVAVYRCDKLLLNNYINHPCVKVHIVDSVTGKYLRRSISNEEQPNDLTSAFIYPMITKAYDMQAKRSLVPYWEEILIFDEDFDFMMNHENPVIIFFEILDFLTFADANMRYTTEGAFSGWHKIAWAFLRPIGKGYLNTEQKLRLQLYKPKKTVILKSSKECVLHDWWRNGELIKYPSSIHVCVKRVKNTKQETPSNENTTQTKNICIHEPDVDFNKDHDYTEKMRPKCKIKWTKKSSHSCKIPTKILSEYKTSDRGCFLIKFSNDGYLLAAGVASLTKYPINIYSISESNLYCKFEGHQGLIYDFNWSPNDVYLISAASDCTVCIWNVTSKEYYPVHTLPHPSFVYCVLLKILEETEIITGCYDKILRVWKADNKMNVNSNYELKQEIEGHTGYITSICSRKQENLFYSSDSLGVVIEWQFSGEKWTLGREFKFKEYSNVIINKIILHPKSDRMFVFCRDSTVRLLDLNSNCILQWYKGALNDRLLLTGCVTPCGTSVFNASEDGTICIWNTNTGILRGTYNPYMNKFKLLTIPYCIDYHPFDHIVTFCHYGSPIPIILCIYHRSFIDIDLKFKNLDEISVDKIVKKNKKKPKLPEALKTNTNINIGGIIEKIDDVLVSAKTL